MTAIGDKWVDWYIGVRQGFIDVCGVVGKSHTGNDLPRLNGGQALAALGFITGPVHDAIKLVSQDGVLWPSTLVKADGSFDTTGPGTPPTAIVHAHGGTISPAIYLGTGIPDKTKPYRHAVKLFEPVSDLPFQQTQQQMSDASVRTFEPARWNQVPLVGGIREAMFPWQRMVDGVSASLTKKADALVSPLALADVDQIMSNFYQTAMEIGAVNALPPQPLRELARDAAKLALTKGSEAVGEAAAIAGEAAGEIIGKVAGGVTKGYFENAGFTSLVVAGTVIYIALR